MITTQFILNNLVPSQNKMLLDKTLDTHNNFPYPVVQVDTSKMFAS